MFAELEYDAAGNLVGVDLAGGRKSIGDADVECLPALGHLTKLRIAGGEVTNAGAKVLGAMTGLVELALLGSQIDDEGFRRLKPLSKLTALNLQRSVNLTDAGLDCLKSFPNLIALGLGDNGFSDRRLPGCTSCRA